MTHHAFIAAMVALFTLTGCARPPASQVPEPAAEPARLVVSPLTVHEPAKQSELSFPNAKIAKSAPPKVERTCPHTDERVLLVGDSLGAGLGPHMGKLARACGTKFFVHGVNGSHVTQWSQPGWLKAQIHRAKPTVVMVSLGGNDFMRNDPEKVERAVNAFVNTVRDSGARLFWISPPSMPFPDKAGVRQMWQSALDGEAWFPTENLEIPRVADRVHPTIPETAKLAGTLWRHVSTLSWAVSSERPADETEPS